MITCNRVTTTELYDCGIGMQQLLVTGKGRTCISEGLDQLNKVYLKSTRKKKKFHDWTWAASNLQPSDLCSNAYRSLPGGQVFSPCYFSCIYIYP